MISECILCREHAGAAHPTQSRESSCKGARCHCCALSLLSRQIFFSSFSFSFSFSFSSTLKLQHSTRTTPPRGVWPTTSSLAWAWWLLALARAGLLSNKPRETIYISSSSWTSWLQIDTVTVSLIIGQSSSELVSVHIHFSTWCTGYSRSWLLSPNHPINGIRIPPCTKRRLHLYHCYSSFGLVCTTYHGSHL